MELPYLKVKFEIQISENEFKNIEVEIPVEPGDVEDLDKLEDWDTAHEVASEIIRDWLEENLRWDWKLRAEK